MWKSAMDDRAARRANPSFEDRRRADEQQRSCGEGRWFRGSAQHHPGMVLEGSTSSGASSARARWGSSSKRRTSSSTRRSRSSAFARDASSTMDRRSVRARGEGRRASNEYVSTRHDVGTTIAASVHRDGVPRGKDLASVIAESGTSARTAVEYALTSARPSRSRIRRGSSIATSSREPAPTERAGGMRIVKVLDFGI